MNDSTNPCPPCPTDAADWIARRQQVRATEWALHHEVLAAARSALQNFQDNSHKTTVADIARLIELASRLGRLAAGMDTEPPPAAVPTIRVEVSAALKRIYSQPVEVLAEQLKQPALPSPSSSVELPDAQP